MRRSAQNPLLSPASLQASPGMEITCVLNPGAFKFDNKIWLIVRVAERPHQTGTEISFPVLSEDGETKIISIDKNDPQLTHTDPRVINYNGCDYLTTLSHLRLFCSNDGLHFNAPEGYERLTGHGPCETFGIEDCRVSFLGGTYYLTYTAVSANGVAVGLRSTTDWKNFQSYGIILPPHNKDCAIFEEKIKDQFYALHRPSSPAIGGNYIWLASSPDGIYWGDHRCILRTRPGCWDSARVGAGASPIKTENGWLEIYHGADENHRYCLGGVLLDLIDPSIVLARSEEPIMVPAADYELTGFFGQVIFTNGHILSDDGDTLTVYYGAADKFICGAVFSVREILASLTFVSRKAGKEAQSLTP